MIRALGIPDVFDDDVADRGKGSGQGSSTRTNVVRHGSTSATSFTITIDPATARDFDDAITLDPGRTRASGRWESTSPMSRTSSGRGRPLDDDRPEAGDQRLPPRPRDPDAARRSSPIAWPASRPGTVRYTVSSAILEFDPGRDPDRPRSFARSVIKVDRRFTYEEAFEVLEHPEGELALTLYPETPRRCSSPDARAGHDPPGKRRFKRGALELSMPEVEIDLGECRAKSSGPTWLRTT